MLAAWTALLGGTEISDLRGWLHRVVHNVALDTVTRRGYDDSVIPDSLIAPARTDELAEGRLSAASALAAIAALPRKPTPGADADRGGGPQPARRRPGDGHQRQRYAPARLPGTLWRPRRGHRDRPAAAHHPTGRGSGSSAGCHRCWCRRRWSRHRREDRWRHRRLCRHRRRDPCASRTPPAGASPEHAQQPRIDHACRTQPPCDVRSSAGPGQGAVDASRWDRCPREHRGRERRRRERRRPAASRRPEPPGRRWPEPPGRRWP